MPVTDFAGTWEYRGSVLPQTSIPPAYLWTSFESGTIAGNGIVRLSYYGDFTNLKTFGYIRPVYNMGDYVYGPWRRIYPKEEKELIAFRPPTELVATGAVLMFFQVTKVYKRWFRKWAPYDTAPSWAVALETLEEPALSPEIAALLNANPGQVLNLGNAGNIVVVLQQENP